MDVEETPRIQNRRRGDGSGRLPDVAEGSNRTADDRQLGIDTSPLRLNNVSEEAAEDHEGSWIYALVKPPQPFASHSEETIKKIVDVFCNAANKKKTLEEFISNRSVLNVSVHSTCGDSFLMPCLISLSFLWMAARVRMELPL